MHLALDPSERYLVISNHLSGSLAVLPVQADGALAEVGQIVTLEGTPGPHRVEQPFAKPHFNPFGPSGALALLQLLSALPDSFTGNSRASEIEIDRAGRTLYASNRGHDSIAMFRIEPRSGRLSFLGAEPAQGRTPRFFALSPNGRWLYVLNEDSDRIVQFAVDQATGRLSPTGHQVSCSSPVCLLFSHS